MKQQDTNTEMTSQPSTDKLRFCDSFGLTGLLCLGFFAAFTAVIIFDGRF